MNYTNHLSKKAEKESILPYWAKEMWENPAFKLVVIGGLTLGAIYGAGYVFRITAYTVNGWKELSSALKR